MNLSSGSSYHLDWVNDPSIRSSQSSARHSVSQGVGGASTQQLQFPLFQGLPREIQDMVFDFAYPPRRVWLRTSMFSSTSGVLYPNLFAGRVPVPVPASLGQVTRQGSGYIDLKRNEDDPFGILVNLRRDMVFIEETYLLRSELQAFADALSRLQMRDRLASIAVDKHMLVLPEKIGYTSAAFAEHVAFVEENRRILKTFGGLELLFILHNARPVPPTRLTRRSRKAFDLTVSRDREHDETFIKELEGLLARDEGRRTVVPTIVIVRHDLRD